MQIFSIAVMWSFPLIKLASLCLWGIQKLKIEYINTLKTTTYGDTYDV